MTGIRIATPRLDLVLQTPDEVLAWVDSLPAADRVEVSLDWIARVRATPVGDPWSLSFDAIERTSGHSVGGCAFKGPPDADGIVEVAYGTNEAHRGKGYATEMADALAAFAIRSGLVRLVRAHTRPDSVASARVLAKSGFTPVGEVVDPEDGLVQRWERAASSHGPRRSRARG